MGHGNGGDAQNAEPHEHNGDKPPEDGNQQFGEQKIGSFYRKREHQIPFVGKKIFVKADGGAERNTKRKRGEGQNVGKDGKSG